MQSKLSEQRKLISKSAGRNDCCIFRVPQGFTDSEVDGKSYQPRTVSIGPYHRGKPHLREMEKHKWRFLERAIQRTRVKTGVGLEDYLKAVEGLTTGARESYSEDITALKGNEFVEMLVLDGCFVVEMFLAFNEVDPFDRDDPFRSMQWIRSSFHEDFLCLKNQIPYIVLQKLFDLTTEGCDICPSLFKTAIDFFYLHPLGHKFEWLHLLDLARKSYFPKTYDEPRRHTHCNLWLLQRAKTKLKRAVERSLLWCFPRVDLGFTPPDVRRVWAMESISKMRRVGITLKLNKDAWRLSFLAVKFERGVIWMPDLELDELTCAFLLNCLAFEQCRGGKDKVVSAYAMFLSCIIRTDKDVDILWEANVLGHSLATQGEVVAFVARLGTCDILESYLKHVFRNVGKHYDNHWHIWTNFKYENFRSYFSSPWKVTSLCAALFLILLTIIQTLIAILEYSKK
ncbi:unnamed protein product [Cuscuta epithymum]|uniref:Uncharacterized protein n=1 Tax=Cuscuta epithymum TaxID=186058 RepID=A0AAV0EM41_9ASTE|nr:unnamed protein product [Cuscuta epithymum]